MRALSTEAKVDLRSGHQVMTSRVTAVRWDGSEFADLPIEPGASVSFDGGQAVRATTTLTIADPELWPGNYRDAPLSPFGTELRVERGIVLPSGRTEWVTLMQGPFKPSRATPATAGFTVEVRDRFSRLATDKFDTAQTFEGARATDEIARLARQTFPELEVRVETESTANVPKMDVQRDRAAALTKMATAIGCDVFFDGPVLVIRDVPTLDDDPVWTFDAGSQGVLVSTDETIDPELAFNYWRASGVAAQPTTAGGEAPPPPPYAVVVDDDPDSPFYIGTYDPGTDAWVGGRWTKTPRLFASPMLATEAQCLTAAQALRERTRGAFVHVDYTVLPMPALEVGDVCLARTAEHAHSVKVICDSFAVGLSSAAGDQAVKTRAIQLPPEETQEVAAA
jgi:hypothetical protein